jgi:hypothetical protein
MHVFIMNYSSKHRTILNMTRTQLTSVDKNKQINCRMSSFECSGDYVQHMQFSDGETYLNGTSAQRRQYPLILVLHSTIENDSSEFFRLVNSRDMFEEQSLHVTVRSLANSSCLSTCAIIGIDGSTDQIHRTTIKTSRRSITCSSSSLLH